MWVLVGLFKENRREKRWILVKNQMLTGVVFNILVQTVEISSFWAVFTSNYSVKQLFKLDLVIDLSYFYKLIINWVKSKKTRAFS